MGRCKYGCVHTRVSSSGVCVLKQWTQTDPLPAGCLTSNQTCMVASMNYFCILSGVFFGCSTWVQPFEVRWFSALWNIRVWPWFLREPPSWQLSKIKHAQLKLELMECPLTLLLCGDLSASLKTGILLCSGVKWQHHNSGLQQLHFIKWRLAPISLRLTHLCLARGHFTPTADL